MKSTRTPRLRSVAIAALGFALSLATSHAGNTWDGTDADDDNWTSNDNWDLNTAPGYGTLTFAGSTRTTNILDANYSMNMLLWTGTSAWTLNSSGGSILSLFDNGGSPAKLENQSSGLVTINAPINFAATAGSGWAEINAVGGDMLFGSTGTITASGAAVGEIRFYGSGRTVTIDSVITAGARKLVIGPTIVDNNTVVLNAANSYSGNTEINVGTVKVGNNGGLGTSTVYIGNGGPTFANLNGVLLLTTSGLAVTNNIVTNKADTGGGLGSGTRTIGGTFTSGTSTYSGTLSIDGGAVLTAGSGGTVTFSGIIANGLGTGNVSRNITVNAPGGTVALTNAGNSYTGSTTVTAGTLDISGAGRLGSGSYAGAISIASGATLRYASSNNQVFSGAVAATGELLKSGVSTLTLSGTSGNSFNGNLTINAGTVSVTGTLNSAANVTLGGTNSTLQLTPAQTWNSLTTATGATGAKVYLTHNGNNFYAVGTVTLNSALTVSKMSNGSQWAGFQTNTKVTGGTTAGTDALILDNLGGIQAYWQNNSTSANDFTGNFRVKGQWRIQSNAPSTNRIVPDAALLVLDNGSQFLWTTSAFTETVDGLAGSGTATIGNNNSGSCVLTINANNTANDLARVFSGTFGAAGASSVTFGGTGTQEFSGSGITYTGGTALNKGTLMLTKATAWGSNITFGASNSPVLQLNSPLSGDSWTFTKQLNGTNTGAKIEKVGLGTVILTPAVSSSFQGSTTGALTVTGGKLYLNAAFTTAPAVSVGNGAVFGGTITAGNVTVANGGTLEGGYNGSGTLTAANVTLGSVAVDSVTIKGTLSTTSGYKPLAVTNLTINGGDQMLVLDAAGLGLTTGTYYDLLVSTNTITAPNATSVFAALKSNARAYTPNLDGTGKKIQLYYDANSSVYWTGAASTAWNSSATNFKLTGNNSDTQFLANDVVYFNDGPVNSTVDISNGNVNPFSVTFANTTATSYTLQGSNGMATGLITKSGDGLLTITNSNSNTGAVALNAGTVSLAQGGGLGTGTITFGGGTLQYTGAANVAWSRAVTVNAGGATIDVQNAAATLSNSGSLSGAGTLVKTGAGTLELPYTTGTISTPLQIDAGTLKLNYGSGNVTYSGPISGSAGILRLEGTGGSATTGLTLTGAMSFAGDVHVNGCRIFLNNTSGNALSGANIRFKTGFWAYHDLTIMRDEQIADSSVLVFETTNSTLYEFRLNGKTETIGGLSCSNGLAIIENAGYDGGNDSGIAVGKLIVDVADGGNYSYNASLRNQNGGSNGALSFEKKGLGTQTMIGDFSYTGATVVHAGTLVLQDPTGGTGFASSGVTMNGGTLDFRRTTGTWTYNNNIVAGTGAGGIAKSGAGTVTLGGANTYTGATAVNEGTLIASGGNAIGDSSAVSIANVAGAILQLNASETIASLAGGGGTGGAVNLQNYTLTTGGDNAPTAFAGVISGTSGNLVKNGTGTFTLSGNNTFTGVTTLSGGTLVANRSSAMGATSASLVLGDANTGANAVEFKVGTAVTAGVTLVSIASSNFGTLRTISIDTGSALPDNAAGLITTLQLTGTGAITLKAANNGGHGTAQDVNWRITGGGIAAGTTALILDGTAKALRISQLGDSSAASNFTGDVLIKGNVSTQGRTYLGSGNIAANQNLNFLNNDVTVDTGAIWSVVWGGETTGALKGSGTILLNNQSALNNTGLTVGNNNRDSSFSGVIQGGFGVAKVGTGTQTFTNANTYSGATTVNGGSLIINNTTGSGTGTGSVSVASGATLGGTGSLGGAVTVTGKIAPGDAGIESLKTGAVTWKGASSAGAATDWGFELGADNGSDLLDITGNFTKDTSEGSGFRFDFLGSDFSGLFTLAQWTGTTNFLAGDFSYTNLGGGRTGTFALNGSTLQFIAIPEPTSAIAGLLLGAGLLRRRRSREPGS